MLRKLRPRQNNDSLIKQRYVVYSNNNSRALPFFVPYCNMASTDDEVVTVQEKQNAIESDLTNGILELLKPAVEQVDRRVLDVRESQLNLREHIDKLTADLQKLMEEQKPPIDLDVYVKKLINCRRKVVVVNSVLNNAHERLNKLQQNIIRETNKKKSTLDASGFNRF